MFKGAKKDAQAMKGVFLFFLLFQTIFLAPLACAGTDPDELYKAGKFSEAEKAYSELDMNNPRNFAFRYNRGCAAYRNGDWKGAAAAFSSVLKRSDDRELQYRAAFNLGNSLYMLERYEEAEKSFEMALEIKPGDRAAARNLELALEEIRKKQEAEREKEREKSGQPGEEGDNPHEQGAGQQQGQEQETPRQGSGENGGGEQGVQDEKPGSEDGGKDASQEERQPGESPENSGKGQQQESDEKARNGQAGSDVRTPPDNARNGTEQEGGQSGDMPETDMKNEHGSEAREAEDAFSGALSSAEAGEDRGEEEKGNSPLPPPVITDRKKAEAMLDNVRENPARMLFYNSSGKDAGKEEKAW
jgi:Ca-activated chloride channel family protein